MFNEGTEVYSSLKVTCIDFRELRRKNKEVCVFFKVLHVIMSGSYTVNASCEGKRRLKLEGGAVSRLWMFICELIG